MNFSPTIFVLGDGPVALVISIVLRAERIGRRENGEGWNWPAGRKKLEAARLILVGVGGGESRLIRWHREARSCPLARRIGVLLFWMDGNEAFELTRRDVFGRAGASDTAFGDWGDDLVLRGADQPLPSLLRGVAGLQCLPGSSWERELRLASCLPELIDALKRHDVGPLRACLPAANATDWDAVCHEGLEGGAHAWANHVRAWLMGVTAGAEPDWKNGLALFLPLCDE